MELEAMARNKGKKNVAKRDDIGGAFDARKLAAAPPLVWCYLPT